LFIINGFGAKNLKPPRNKVMRMTLPLVTIAYLQSSASGFSPPKPENKALKYTAPGLPSSGHFPVPKLIPKQLRVVNECASQQATGTQWLFRKASSLLLNTDWKQLDEEVDPRLVEQLTNATLSPPIYYKNKLVHAMEPLSAEQAKAERPSMDVLSITLADRDSLYDLSAQILNKQGFINSEQPPQSPGLQVVDIGCGTGTLAQKLLEQHSDQIAHIHGVDASPYKLAKFLQTTPEAHQSQISMHHLLGENMHSLSNNSMDRVVISFVFHELPSGISRKILNEALRVLKPGCTIHIVDMDRMNPRIQGLASTNVHNWLMEPYMDNYLKTDFEDTLSRLKFTDVRLMNLESNAPIIGITARKPISSSISMPPTKTGNDK
jgi:ubiquinone/menaquinone biosynthesis C-methylase UbiE